MNESLPSNLANGDDRPLLLVDRVSKAYGGVHALQNVSLHVRRGEVHAICGENGAGKSTLIKLLSGVVTPDSGQLLMDGLALPTGNVRAAENAGIAVLHQESTAFPDLNAVDNIFVGRERTTAGGLLLARRAMRAEAGHLLDQLGATIDLRVPLSQLSLAHRQVVSMARAMSCDCKLFILDEPTASLSIQEAKALLKLVQKLADQAISVIYVSHRLEEVFQVADRISVLRDGRLIATHNVEEVDRRRLVQLMVGRELDELTRRHQRVVSRSADQPPVMEVSGLAKRAVFEDVSFSIAPGEILGLAGLVGSGRSELAKAIFGIDEYDQGTIRVGGELLQGGSVAAAKRAGMAMVPEDRQHEGLILPMSVQSNLSLASLDQFATFGWVDTACEKDAAEKQIAKLQIKAADPLAPVETLSGGNQQKVVIGKWLATRPNMLILDEPTRGVDVAAKAQVHRFIRQLASRGMATLMISSELPEVLTMCDRILVMREGCIVAEFQGCDATEEQLLSAALAGESRQVV